MMTLVLTFLALAHAAQYETFNVLNISGEPYHIAMMNPENGITVQCLKESIAREHHIPAEYQNLLFGTDVLHNDEIIQPETHPTLTLLKIIPSFDSLPELCAKGYVDGIRYLLAAGCDPNKMDRYGHTGLLLAAKNGHSDVVRLLLNEGVDPDQTRGNSTNGLTALHCAASAGHPEVVRLLIENNCDLNYAHKEIGMGTWTALHFAAEKGHSDVVRLLAEQKSCNLNKTTGGQFYQDTALMLAATLGRAEVTYILLKAGCDYKHANSYGETAMSYAKDRDHYRIVLQILRRKRPFAWF